MGIKFVGTGEKLGDFEQFHPERMASRILGMGDMLTLIERAQSTFDEENSRKLSERLKENIIFCISSNCLRSLFTSATEFPLPAAILRFRFGSIIEGLARR